MRFSWDPDKSDATLHARGFDFACAALIFEGPTLEREDTRKEYGERRIIAIGGVDGVALTVCYTDRTLPGAVPERRIISARRSDSRERQALKEAIEDH